MPSNIQSPRYDTPGARPSPGQFPPGVVYVNFPDAAIGFIDGSGNPVDATQGGIYVPLAGGTMSGPLILSGPPTVPLGAATKAYSEQVAAARAPRVWIAAAPPVAPVPGDLWYENNSIGRGFIWDGQVWVDFCPALPPPDPDLGGFVAKAGDTMTGLLTLSRAGFNEQLRVGYSTGDTRDALIGFYRGDTTLKGHVQVFSDRVQVTHVGGAALALYGSGDARVNGSTIWHAGNDGAGSALDADLLDGQQGAWYRDAGNLNAGVLPAARFTDTSHGNRGGGALHAVATASVAGFMSAADKTKLNGLDGGAYVLKGGDSMTGLLTMSRASGEQIRIGANAGAALDAFISLYRGEATRAGYLQAQSTNLRLVRDSGASLELYGPDDVRINGATVWHADNDGAGSGLDADLLDGQSGAYYLSASNLNAGTLPAARFNDTSHGNRAGGSLHAVATTSVDGFMDSADKTKLNGIETGADKTDAANVAAAGAIMDADFPGTGLMVSQSGSYTTRAIAGSTGINVTNGNGTGGNPTVAVDASVVRDATLPAELAALSAGGVGTYALLKQESGTAANFGDTKSGSILRATNASGQADGGFRSGSWRCMGTITGVNDNDHSTTLWLRIS